MNIRSSDTIKDTQNDSIDYNTINTHSSTEGLKIYPMDLLKLELIDETDVTNYKEQMINIIIKVMNIFKLNCQIYEETENGFMELGFDFMIGLNDKIYLAEINTDLGISDYRDSERTIPSMYNILNDNILNTIIRGIIEPVLVTNKYIHNLPEYDGFTEIIISENLENEPGREGLSIKETPTYIRGQRTLSSTRRNPSAKHNRTSSNWRKPSANNRTLRSWRHPPS